MDLIGIHNSVEYIYLKWTIQVIYSILKYKWIIRKKSFKRAICTQFRTSSVLLVPDQSPDNQILTVWTGVIDSYICDLGATS